MSGIDPQGCHAYSFKAPSQEELDHDFLWRCYRALPERGRIGIFNRSYYEEVLVVKVHRELLAKQKLPDRLIGRDVWEQRYEDIRMMERHLARSGTLILKFFLNMSREEQKKQFLERIDDPSKNWKFSAGDVKEREHWDAYMDAYQAMIRATSAPHAPWYVVPADNKWYTRIVVAAAIVEGLASLDLHYPRLDKAKLAELAEARKALLAEPKRKRS
jgi:PPK2 family polyphosphate:nucleotide phosphotransferase